MKNIPSENPEGDRKTETGSWGFSDTAGVIVPASRFHGNPLRRCEIMRRPAPDALSANQDP
ncbi:MAG TPA: hypothetical protein DDZ83_09565 [Nitrospinae bacterium]|nr:hypothetical protein [Nitrospinota bacterium]